MIVLVALATFLLGLWTVFLLESKNITSEKIESSINNAEKLSALDQTITFERGLKIYDPNLSFAIFDRTCKPIYLTNLMIFEGLCQVRHKDFNWRNFRSASGNHYILGFSSQLTIKTFLANYSDILIPILSVYILFISLLSLFFLRLFLLQPVQLLSRTVDVLINDKVFDEAKLFSQSHFLLSTLYKSVGTLLKEAVKFNGEREKVALSKQVVHDLRAPLSVLENHVNLKTNKDPIENLALKRIREISNSLLSEAKIETDKEFDINECLTDLALLYPMITARIVTTSPTESNKLVLPEIEIFRFLSNLIKNSLEANATTIELEARNSRPGFLELIVRDNGCGSNIKDMPEILDGYTTKKDGHGLGLSSIKNKLHICGGSFEIDTSINSGFKVSMQIPYDQPQNFILIDDDKLIRLSWSMSAKNKGINLVCFDNVQAFLDSIDPQTKNAVVYIDSNLKDNVKGEIEAKRIFAAGFKVIYLATGYSSDYFDLKSMPWIEGIISKSPPF